jgi:hypothetical protein
VRPRPLNPNEPYQSQPERKITTPNPHKPTTCKGAHFIYTEDVGGSQSRLISASRRSVTLNHSPLWRSAANSLCNVFSSAGPPAAMPMISQSWGDQTWIFSIRLLGSYEYPILTKSPQRRKYTTDAARFCSKSKALTAASAPVPIALLLICSLCQSCVTPCQWFVSRS